MKVTQYPYLKDSELLNKIDNLKIKKQWARIVLLDWEEKPIQEIQAYIVNGNLNLTGDSAIRRTGNLTVYIDDEKNGKITNVDNLFSINKKIYLEIGYENPNYMKEEERPLRSGAKGIVDYGPYVSPINKYPIFWFPQGIFVVNSASSTHNSGGINLSLSLKDKMCLLNGDCGGVITSSVQFDQYDTMDENGEWILTRPTIYQIILELVNHFGEEDMSRILIEGVDTRVKQCMKWIGNTPLYLYGSDDAKIATTNYDSIPPESQAGAQEYTYGDDVGFIYTDFTYPGELVAKPGDTVVSILDKIKNTLGNFEYFYDVEGNFHFREIKNYLNTTQSTDILNNLTNESYYVFDLSKGKAEYDFTDSPLIISYSNSPQYSKIKNDYVVWGTRKNTDGINIPIRYHLAIDKKPKTGNTYEVYLYKDEEDGLIKAKKPLEYINRNAFPEIGSQGVFYLDLTSGIIYKWEGLDEQYVPFNDFPSIYQKVEYIENTANNYIDIDYIPNENTRIYIEASQSTKGDSLQSLFGSALPITDYYVIQYKNIGEDFQTERFTSYNDLLNFIATLSNTEFINIYMANNADEVDAFDCGIDPIDNINIDIGNITGETEKKSSLGTKFTVEINLQETTPNIQINQDVISKYNTVDYSQSENEYSLSLFALHEGNSYKNYFLGKIYNCQIWDKDNQNQSVLVRNLIPCYYKQSGQIGLYDTIEKVFYPAQGTGTMSKGEDVETDLLFTSITTGPEDWRTELYLEGVVSEPYGLKSNYYFAELEAEWPKIFDLENNCYKDEVLAHPEDLDYWLDFIDSETEISKISVGNIGRRPQAKQMSEINCVFEPEVPDVIFIELGQSDTETKRQECQDRQQYYTQVDSELFKNLATGGMSNSAYNEVRNMLYQGSSYNESISISTIPIYYLEPNIRITAFDSDSDIHGDYIIKSISLPLDINGTSNISATRALNQF